MAASLIEREEVSVGVAAKDQPAAGRNHIMPARRSCFHVMRPVSTLMARTVPILSVPGAI
jgi:hypothetical protein